MKPVKLQFKGINSFSEQTVIDFESLTKNGIFGIFGDTGSGKSTILDCINFALYGKVERSREKLDIINYNSDEAKVEFIFDVLTEGKRKRYTVERSIKKKSGIHKATLYEDEECIADNASTVTKKITEVLGVDAEDFRKCIALPQGEFAQFVKSQPSERISLIERLFSLSKYGDRLKDRLKVRENQAELNYQTLCAQLTLYSEVSNQALKDLESLIKELKNQQESLTCESSAAEKEYIRLKNLGEKYSELNECVINLSALQSQKPHIEKLRSGLKVAPLCRAVVEVDEEICAKNNALLINAKKLSEYEKSVEAEKQKILQLNERQSKDVYDEKIAKCLTLSAKFQSCEGKPEKLAGLTKRLENKRKEYRVKEDELAKLKIKFEGLKSEVKQAEKELADCGSADLEQLINVKFKGAVLRDEYVNSLDYFVGLNGQVKFHKDNSELYSFIERELKQQIEIYRDKVYQVKDFNLQDAEKQLKSIQATGKEREKITAKINEKKAVLNNVQSAINDCEKDMRIIQRDGAELRNQFDDINAELLKTFGPINDFVAAVKENENALTMLKSQKSQLSAESEAANTKLLQLTAEQAALQAEGKALSCEIEKLSVKLKNSLVQSGLDNVQSCKNIIDEYSRYPEAEKTLEKYDSELITLTARRAQLEKIGVGTYSQNLFSEAEQKKNSLTSELTKLREKIAVLESDKKKAEERLKEKEILQKRLTSAEKERNLIAQLKDLTKGNKFMEYIANEYLYDISALASSTLLNLTDGRYFLTYTDTFYAGDNFNCGNLRGVNTLSGGETFLVSLSLALALSQTICASLKSIEFFFLDEGFGTLDSSLVDTVMNALEKLKSSRFTIGVISHVEELKHRIDNKITVSKATESHGSTVQISG